MSKGNLRIELVKLKDMTIYTSSEPINANLPLMQLYVVGFYVREDKEVLVLAFELSEDGLEVRYTLVIPKDLIILRKKIIVEAGKRPHRVFLPPVLTI